MFVDALGNWIVVLGAAIGVACTALTVYGHVRLAREWQPGEPDRLTLLTWIARFQVAGGMGLGLVLAETIRLGVAVVLKALHG